MAKKAFAEKRAFSSEGEGVETLSERSRQFAVGRQSNKRPATYKIDNDVREKVEEKATELSRSIGRKVWPAHITEAALRAFLRMTKAQQQELLEQVQ